MLSRSSPVIVLTAHSVLLGAPSQFSGGLSPDHGDRLPLLDPDARRLSGTFRSRLRFIQRDCLLESDDVLISLTSGYRQRPVYINLYLPPFSDEFFFLPSTSTKLSNFDLSTRPSQLQLTSTPSHLILQSTFRFAHLLVQDLINTTDLADRPCRSHFATPTTSRLQHSMVCIDTHPL